jgi:hypothetical protein
MDNNNDIQLEAIDERIDSFIRGTMTKDEEAAFKQEIKADAELRNHVLSTLSLIKGIREQESEKEKALFTPKVTDKTRTLLKWACSIAAVFAIFFAYQKDQRYNELSNIVSPYYSEYNMDDISRGDTDSAKVTHLYTLFNNIKEQRNVSSIIAELEPIYESLDSDFTYNAYANDIAWNLALAYVKDDKTDKATSILEKLKADDPDTQISIKAQELLKRIREL